MKHKLSLIIKGIALLMVSAIATQLSAQRVALENNWGEHGTTVLDQSKKGVSLNFSVEEYQLTDTEVNKSVMKTITTSGILLQNSEGYPDVPGYSRYIAIPQGATPKFEIVRKQTQTVQNIEIAPAPRIPLDTDLGPLEYKKNPDVYNKNAFYPNNIVQLSKPMKMRGMDVVLIAVSPFQYNPVTKELIINQDIEIDVTFEGGNGQFGDDRLRSRFWDPIIRDAVVNEATIPEKKVSAQTRSQTGFEYIIIVPDDPVYKQWADSIRIFRLKQGISTEVYTTTDVGGNNRTSIEGFINNAYNTWDVPPAACLLMADFGSENTTGTIFSPTWDNYCISDNYYGDIDEDMMPDVVMARMTAQNATHLETMVTKFINHERNPPTNPGFYDNPITAMGWQTERWFQICSETIAGFFENELGKSPKRENALYSGNSNGPWSTATNTQVVLDYFGPNGLGYIPATPSYLTDWGGNATRVNNDINSGAFLLQHRDHGSETGWGEPAYNMSSIDGLTNNDLVYVFSINCLTGKFNINSECFAEKFHRYTYNGNNSGALGIMAATEVSYSFVNDTYTWGMYDNMWPNFMPDYGTTPDHRGVMPGFGNAAGKYFLQQSSWPYNTSNKEVTYYLFHHHGDAFSTLYTVVPITNNIVHDDIMLSGLDYFTIKANAGSTVCLTVGETVIGLAEADGTPMDIPIIAQEPGTLVDIVITLQDHYRYETTVEVIPPDGPYCMYADHVITDTAGTILPHVQFDEEVFISLTMKNLGSEDGIDIVVTLESDQYATFIDNTESFDTILIGEYKTCDDGFKVKISDGVPDEHILNFEVTATDFEDSTWTSSFSTTVMAPDITPGALIIDDDAQGNGNGILDPGETCDMKVNVSNMGHCYIQDVVCTMTSYNQFITVNSGQQTIPTLGFFGNFYATFNVTVADDAPDAIIAEMLFNASAAGYSIDQAYFPKIGMFLEDWETGDFSKYNWQSDGDLAWDITNVYPYEGNYHAVSGPIGDNSSSEFKITYEVLSSDDSIKFWKKVSSEPDFDELKFYIDNTEIAAWSGYSESWTHQAYPIPAGYHTFRWVYEKDFSGIAGSDCAWIDYIELPTMMVTTIFAGPDADNCEEQPFQCEGSATNYQTVQWLTSGDGEFNNSTILRPHYTPGPQDIIAGNVNLTLTIVDDDGEEFEDEMTLTLFGGPIAPEAPVGPDHVDVYKVLETEYTCFHVDNAIDYIWTISPEEAGTIISVDTFAIVQWNNTYLGEALLTVQGTNYCGEGDISEALTIMVDNTVGIGNTQIDGVEINIVPNPNNGIFDLNIVSDSDKAITISLVNYLGVEILKKEGINVNSGFTYHMENTELPAGIYILNVEQGDRNISRKVLISN